MRSSRSGGSLFGFGRRSQEASQESTQPPPAPTLPPAAQPLAVDDGLMAEDVSSVSDFSIDDLPMSWQQRATATATVTAGGGPAAGAALRAARRSSGSLSELGEGGGLSQSAAESDFSDDQPSPPAFARSRAGGGGGGAAMVAPSPPLASPANPLLALALAQAGADPLLALARASGPPGEFDGKEDASEASDSFNDIMEELASVRQSTQGSISATPRTGERSEATELPWSARASLGALPIARYSEDVDSSDDGSEEQPAPLLKKAPRDSAEGAEVQGTADGAARTEAELRAISSVMAQPQLPGSQGVPPPAQSGRLSSSRLGPGLAAVAELPDLAEGDEEDGSEDPASEDVSAASGGALAAAGAALAAAGAAVSSPGAPTRRSGVITGQAGGLLSRSSSGLGSRAGSGRDSPVSLSECSEASAVSLSLEQAASGQLPLSATPDAPFHRRVVPVGVGFASSGSSASSSRQSSRRPSVGADGVGLGGGAGYHLLLQ
ncbi:hypothetical protein T492DRAFT_162798 [Pavlovales sp. CCMP2436]|nr:hypothetical protein T492DRAFT_162798 [Pavlovales sp. CCMP2436]